jgi:hypothetical protein
MVFPGPVVVRHVAGEDGVGARERAGPDHGAGSRAALLRRLKQEHDIAFGPVGLYEQPRGPEHHRHVSVVAARMNAPRVLRRER